MIEFHFAEPAPGPSYPSLSETGLNYWLMFMDYSDTMIGYKEDLNLDIVIADIPFRRFQSETLADPMACLVDAYERAKVITEHLPEFRMKWITLCGHHSSIIPDRNNPIHFSSLGPESVGAMALMEGGANFIARDGQVIGNEQWNSAEKYFLRLLGEYGLVPSTN